MQGYPASDLEDALCALWELVEGRLTDEDLKRLGVRLDVKDVRGIFEELHSFGTGGPVGIGLGRCGGHAVG